MSRVAALIILVMSAMAHAEAKYETLSDILDEKFFDHSVVLNWSTDPFQKLPGFATIEAERSEEPKLDAVLYSHRDPAAIVSGQSVWVGDDVNGYRVQSIGKNFVRLEQKDSLIEIALPPTPESTEKLEIHEHGN